jgi:hypothetical protein
MRLRRTAAVLLAAVLAFFAAVSPARADSTEATRAADWIVANAPQATWDTETEGPGSVVNQVLALASTGDLAYKDEIATRVQFLKDKASAYSADPVGAAKLGLVAASVAENPRDFGGVDLIATTLDGVKADGSIGEYPGPFASGIAILAISRAGADVPSTMADYLLTYQLPDGGFYGWAPAEGEEPAFDPDSTALAAMALDAVGKDSSKAVAAMEAAQQPDGSFVAFAPVNTAGMVGPLLSDQAKDKARAYVVSQQLADGGLPTGAADAPDANLLATAQGIFALTGQTYATITYDTAALEAEDAPAAAGSPWAALGVFAGAIVVCLIGVGLVARGSAPKA